MKLNCHVPVTDDMLRVHVFGPDDVLPDWVAAKIKNPGVWEIPPVPQGEPITDEDQAQSPDPAPLVTEGGSAADMQDGLNPEVVPLAIPPKGGPKATAEAWREYALEAVIRAGLNIDIPADAGRNDIIDALTEAGIATE